MFLLSINTLYNRKLNNKYSQHQLFRGYTTISPYPEFYYWADTIQSMLEFSQIVEIYFYYPYLKIYKYESVDLFCRSPPYVH